jgi:SAM-dependent methyltransferase
VSVCIRRKPLLRKGLAEGRDSPTARQDDVRYSASMNQPGITYNPHVFDVATIGDAMQIILTPEDSTTEHRWVTETPYLANLISRCFSLTEKSLVLDYGCGIGRLAKELISRHGCSVIGVDISASMRSIAVAYVGSDRFFACPPAMLDLLLTRGVAFDLALSVWVLQHCVNVRDDIALISRALVPEGGLFVVNQRSRAVPTVELGWVDDGADVYALLKEGFRQRSRGSLPAEHTTKNVSRFASWAAFRRL